MIVMQHLIKDKVRADIFYPTGNQDAITIDKPKDTLVCLQMVTGNLGIELKHKASANKSDTTVKNLIWLLLVKETEAKHLASANKSDKTVKDLIWLLKFSFAIHIFS